MPLPSGGAWPPEDLAPVFTKFNEWSAWYAGSPDLLATVYGGQASAGDQTKTGFFASQQGGFKAGVRNFFQRYFHGTATSPTEQRTKLHVPVAGDIAATSAELLFSEPPSMKIDDKKTQDRLDDLVDDGVHATLLEAAEVASALGGCYLRVCWDVDVDSTRPWLAAVHADAAVPEWKYGRLMAVTFWQVLEDDGRNVIRHLERHEPGVILHGVYAGTRNELGRRIALTDMPQTAGIADALTGPDEISTGVKMLTAVYVPNMRPNRIWRTAPAASYYGRSDYQGVELLMDALDEVYSSWMRDIRLAKARLIVPEVYLQSQGAGKGARWDSEQEIYSTVNALAGQSGQMQLTPVQFQIRVQEHMESAQHLLEQILRDAGYSSQTFGLSGDAAVTATEVAARERKSFVTRDKKINYWRPALRDIIEALLAVDAVQFHSGVTPDKPVVEFGDTVSEDPAAVAQTVQLLFAAESASTETRVKLVNPDWDDTQVAEEVAKIQAEQQAASPLSVPGPDGMGGLPGPGTPDPMMNGAGY